MNEISDSKTQLLISPKKIAISTNLNSNFDIIHESEIFIPDSNDEINFEILSKFLNENIYKIEKKSKSFVEKLNLIIDCKYFLTVGISVKKNTVNGSVNRDDIIYLLNDAKEQCKKSSEGKKIIHLLIKNYRLDNNNYLHIPKDVKYKNFSLDLEFIYLSEEIIQKVEQVLKKYQILIDQIISLEYLRVFFDGRSDNTFLLAKKITEGCNENEVDIISKIPKNIGFFEKFFNFFS